jgi:hypothetical protein
MDVLANRLSRAVTPVLAPVEREACLDGPLMYEWIPRDRTQGARGWVHDD